MNTPSTVVEQFTFDSFFIPEDIQEIPPETPAKVDPPVAIEEPSIEIPPPIVEEPPVERSTWSNLLYSMKEVDKVLPETLEIPNDLTPEQMKTLLMETIDKEVMEKRAPDLDSLKQQEFNKLIEKGYTADQIERGLFYSEHLQSGGSEEVVSRHSYLDLLANVEPANESEELQIIRQFQALRGQDPELVETSLQAHFVSKEGEDMEDDNEAIAEKRKKAVDAAQQGIARIRDVEFEQDKTRAKAAKESAEQAKLEDRKSLEKTIDSGFMGTKLNKQEADKFKKDIFDVASYRDIQTPQGVKRIPETAEAKAWREVMSNPEKRLTFAYLALNGVESVINNATRKASDSFLKAIDKNPSQIPELQITPRSRQPTNGSLDGGFILPI